MTVLREAVSTFAEINLQNGNKGAFQYGLEAEPSHFASGTSPSENQPPGNWPET